MRFHVLPENPPDEASVRVRPTPGRQRPPRISREGHV